MSDTLLQTLALQVEQGTAPASPSVALLIGGQVVEGELLSQSAYLAQLSARFPALAPGGPSAAEPGYLYLATKEMVWRVPLAAVDGWGWALPKSPVQTKGRQPPPATITVGSFD